MDIRYNKIICENLGKNFVLSGPVWVWKTYLAKEIVKLLKSKKKGDFENLREYFITDSKFKQLVKSNSLIMRKPEEWTLTPTLFPLEMMIKSDFLIYDDVWTSDTTPAYLRDLLFVIDERFEKKQTIYTTNLTFKEIKEKLWERISSRMLYNSCVISMNGEDRRKTTTLFYNL